MSAAAVMTAPVVKTSPLFKARMAGLFYLFTFLTGGVALFNRGRLGAAAGLVAGACYVVVTLLLYGLFRPAGKNLSLLAAFISLVGCALGPLTALHLVPAYINSLVAFGVYCLLIGYLILRSTFLPHVLGALMAFAGLGWLTFLSPPLANQLSPYVFAPGLLGEGALTVWLLVKGVDVPRWHEQAGA